MRLGADWTDFVRPRDPEDRSCNCGCGTEDPQFHLIPPGVIVPEVEEDEEPEDEEPEDESPRCDCCDNVADLDPDTGLCEPCAYEGELERQHIAFESRSSLFL